VGITEKFRKVQELYIVTFYAFLREGRLALEGSHDMSFGWSFGDVRDYGMAGMISVAGIDSLFP
jgi:hypothetical protein